MKKIAIIVIMDATRNFDKKYHYYISNEHKDKLFVGSRVLVPFGKLNKEVDGLIIDIFESNESIPLKEVKNITEVLALSKEMIDLAEWMKERYICTYGDAIRCMLLPQKSKKTSKTIRMAYLVRSKEEIIDEIESDKINRIHHIRVLEILIDNENIAVSDLMSFANVSNSVLNTLKKHGFIDFKNVEVIREPLVKKDIPKSFPLNPTKEQFFAITFVKDLINKKSYEEVLLHGITGSGKTEIYLQLIEYVTTNKKQAIVLVPEIALTPQMVERFKGRFGEKVAILHSKLSMGEKFDQWRLVKEKKVDIVVGARSAIFAPFENIGIIIIDEEHEYTYKSEITPKYNAKEIAKKRCEYNNAILLYGSATPSEEVFYNAKINKIKLITLQERTNGLNLPNVVTVDMRKELNQGNRSIFSRVLINEIEKNLKNNEQTILFLNKRGYASFVLCRNCGFTAKCPSCDISLTYHSNNERLICHYCGFTEKNYTVCKKCNSSYIKNFGSGTQKVEAEVRKMFKDVSVIRMDMDTTSCKNSHQELLHEFREKNINILIGTQMIAKGHDFPNVTLVGVLAADALLNFGDFRSSERTFQLITQVAGRAGRGEKSGRVIVQSYSIEDYSIVNACKHDYISFYQQDILFRQKLLYPPFTNIGVLIIKGKDDILVYKASKDLKCLLIKKFDINLLGPSKAPIAKVNGKFRWRILIKSENIDELIEQLTFVKDNFNKVFKNKDVELSVDINPNNML